MFKTDLRSLFTHCFATIKLVYPRLSGNTPFFPCFCDFCFCSLLGMSSFISTCQNSLGLFQSLKIQNKCSRVLILSNLDSGYLVLVLPIILLYVEIIL